MSENIEDLKSILKIRIRSATTNFLPRYDVYIFPSRVFRCLAFLELSTGSVHCAPDENDRPSEQTELCFAFVNLCCFLNSLFVELTKIRA